ncbi:DUF192 domain-containing protein [Pollutimonas thiosulfatoxidans]|uniref:DUF192 domain-containing protein n=1 Tax=Pollutimonas thiosulfatoxidans TaxID=2028345 RepID=A0A410GAB9_9BURK|nr:DUF192 domain-containing protein [Pollutimonas thiosulfatoxidans]QAA93260.1 hypothetical protein CKA81_04975 [Pollutimonas thiosulfatoxidans]
MSLYIHSAQTFMARLLGLHARRLDGENGGLHLDPCRAVHTFGLPDAIDLVFLDRHCLPVRVVCSLPPWRIAICARARSVVELPAGYCQAHPDFAVRIRLALRP